MAALALGVVGGLIGGPVGFLAGELLGNLLFPQKVDGPRLTDLRLHTSSTGGMVPILMGTMRVAGNVIWETDLSEHSQTSGGKGGPETTTFTYTASFAVAFGEGYQGTIAGISRIWGNGRLIFDPNAPAGSLGTPLPMTVYLGGEDQLADPTMEAVLGTGNVPAFRGVAYVVFADYLLTQWGNTLPNLEFEVYTAAAAIPIRVSLFSSNPDDTSNGPFASYDASTGVITVSEWSPGNRGGYAERQWLIDGTAVSSLPETPMPGFATLSAVILNSNIAVIGDGGGNIYWYYRGGLITTLPDGSTGTFILRITSGSAFDEGFFFVDPATGNQYIYVRDGISPLVSRYPCFGFLPVADYDRQVNTGFGSNIKFGASDNGKVYMHEGPNINEYTPDLVLTHSWTASDFPAGFNTAALFDALIVRRNNLFAFSYAGIGFDTLNLVSIAADNTLSLYPQERAGSDIPTYQFLRGDISPLYGGYVLGKDGVTLLDPPIAEITLASMVANQSDRVGFDASQYDVSQLTQLVHGAYIDSQRAARDNIAEWQQTYFFDGAEVDGKIVFVPRGGAPTITIDDDDLATFGQGETPPPQVGIVRVAQADLPQQVTVNYVAPDQDYQTGTQLAQRQTVNLQNPNKVTLDLKIALSDPDALAVAYKQLYSAYVERQKSTTSVPRKYAQVVPTDVVAIKGNAIAVRQTSWTLAGAIKMDGVPSYAQVVQQQAPTAVPPLGFTSSPPVPAMLAATLADPLDLPLIADVDRPDGYYLAMAGKAGQWPGAAWMQSNDGGANYAQDFSETVAQVIGTASTALGPFAAGNVFDESNSVTVVATTGGTLASATELSVLNGANECVIGSEVLQFKNATLTAPNTYLLTGFLRGRMGTEWAIGSHGIGERFAMLPAPRVASPYSDIGLNRLYKPVTFGATLASVPAQPFVNTGVALKPYAPVQLGGGVNAAGDVTLVWLRRTRVGGAWLSFVDVPLSEASEAYVVQIWNAAYTQVAVIMIVTAPTATYFAANQVTNFGATQQTIFFTVNQLGSAGPGTQARGSAPGAGASNNDPLAPIPPYGS
jgi:hypothetical protein